MGNYDDIINMPHHVSTRHPRMSIHDRSAQFAPFAALVGYDEMVEETARFVSERIEINEELREELDRKLQEIKEKIETKPTVTLTYFVQDLKKSGGKYVTIIGKVIKIDEYKKRIILEDNTQISIQEIIGIGGEIFE